MPPIASRVAVGDRPTLARGMAAAGQTAADLDGLKALMTQVCELPEGAEEEPEEGEGEPS